MELPRLEEHYDLGEEIGRGGFGVVLAGQRKADGAAAAIKIAHEHLGDDPRVLREVERLRSLRHPRLAELHGLFSTGAGKQALVYELVPGKPVDEVLEARQRVDPAVLCRDIGAALDALHQAGLVHRDVKAPNVMAEPDGQFRLVDYGLLRGVDEGDTVTATGMIVGTVATMPPEQFLGGRLGPRSDLYSLACIVFLAAEGRDPFPEEHPGENLEAKRIGPPRVGDRDAFYKRALHPDPQARFATGGEMAAAFARGGASRGAPAHDATQMLSSSAEMTAPLGAAPVAAPGPVAGKPAPSGGTSVVAPPEPPATPLWQRPGILVALFVCLTLGAAIPEASSGPTGTAPASSPPPPPSPTVAVPSLWFDLLADLEAWAYPPGVPWYVDLEDAALLDEAVSWTRMEGVCAPLDQAVQQLYQAASHGASAEDRAGLVAILPRVARVARQIRTARGKLEGEINMFSGDFLTERGSSGGYSLSVVDRRRCLKRGIEADRAVTWVHLERAANATDQPPLQVALDLALAAHLSPKRVLERAGSLRVIARKLPASLRAHLFSDLLAQDPFRFGPKGATHDEDNEKLKRLSCKLAVEWSATPAPPRGPASQGEAAAEALELLWRIRLGILAIPDCGDPTVKLPDQIERLTELVESPDLDRRTLNLVHRRTRLGDRPLGQVAKAHRPRLARRLEILSNRAELRAHLATVPRSPAGWEEYLDRIAWEYKGAQRWDVLLEGDLLSGDSDVNVYKRGHLGVAIRLQDAFWTYWEETLDELDHAEDLVDAVIHGADPSSWPASARGRLQRLDAGFSPEGASYRVRPLFPYVHVLPSEEEVPRPAALGARGPARAEGWLGAAYRHAVGAGVAGSEAEETWAALFALGQASRRDEVPGEVAVAQGRALLEGLGSAAHPALAQLEAEQLLGRKVDEDEPPWDDFVRALEAFQARALPEVQEGSPAP